MLSLTLVPHSKARTELEPVELEEHELALELDPANARIGEKDGAAIIPALFKNCPRQCLKAKHGGNSYDCGGSSPHRLKSNVTHMTALCVDLDHLTEQQESEIGEKLYNQKVEFYWWQTHSGSGHLRVLIPFVSPLPVTSAQWWSEKAWPTLVEHFGLTQYADKACSDPCRIYFLPSKPTEQEKRDGGFVEGERFDTGVANIPEDVPQPETAVPLSLVQDEDPNRPVDLESVRNRMRTIHREPEARYIANALAGRALVPPPGKRKEGDLPRYLAWRTLTNQVALLAEPWESSEALLEVLRPAHVQEVAESPEDYTPWETIAGLLVSGRASAPEHKARREANRKAMRDAVLKRLGPREGEAPAEDSEEEEDGSSISNGQEREVVFQRDKDGNQTDQVAKTIGNLLTILQKQGGVRFNVMTAEIEISGLKIRDDDIVNTQAELVEAFGLTYSRDDVREAFGWVAQRNKYDPVLEYLEGLTWDGVCRIDTMLVSYFGCQDNEYTRAVSRKWMISAVARGMQPGCKVDTVLVLEGEQGKRKSAALGALAGNWFSDDHMDLDYGYKEAYALARANWIVEIGELETVKRASATKLKAFFSKQVDQYRPAYGRYTVTSPRHCVFVGTTNEARYLTDETGNRRYWPVRTGVISSERVARDRDQLWAEAMKAYKAGEKWWFTEDQENQAAEETRERIVQDLWPSKIVKWLMQRPKRDRIKQFTFLQLAEALEVSKEPQVEVKLGRALKLLNFRSERQTVAGRKESVYFTPVDILEAETLVPHPTTMSVISGGKPGATIK